MAVGSSMKDRLILSVAAVVASKRPPRPVSITTMSQFSAANHKRATAVTASNSTGHSPYSSIISSQAAKTRPVSAVRVRLGIISPLICILSRKSST